MRWPWKLGGFIMAYTLGCRNAFTGNTAGIITCFLGAIFFAFGLGMDANSSLMTRMLTPHWRCGRNHRACDPCPKKGDQPS